MSNVITRVLMLTILIATGSACSTWGGISGKGSAGVQRVHSGGGNGEQQAVAESSERQQVSGTQCNVTPLLLETMSREQRCYTFNQLNKVQQNALINGLTTEQNLKYFGGCNSQ